MGSPLLSFPFFPGHRPKDTPWRIQPGDPCIPGFPGGKEKSSGASYWVYRTPSILVNEFLLVRGIDGDGDQEKDQQRECRGWGRRNGVSWDLLSEVRGGSKGIPGCLRDREKGADRVRYPATPIPVFHASGSAGALSEGASGR